MNCLTLETMALEMFKNKALTKQAQYCPWACVQLECRVKHPPRVELGLKNKKWIRNLIRFVSRLEFGFVWNSILLLGIYSWGCIKGTPFFEWNPLFWIRMHSCFGVESTIWGWNPLFWVGIHYFGLEATIFVLQESTILGWNPLFRVGIHYFGLESIISGRDPRFRGGIHYFW